LFVIRRFTQLSRASIIVFI